MANELAFFYEKEQKFIWSFPYLKQAFILNYIFFTSLFATLKKTWQEDEPISSVIFSDYMVMNIFVVFMTTVEYLTKSFASTLLSGLFILSSRNQKNTLHQTIHTIYLITAKASENNRGLIMTLIKILQH